MSCSLNNFEENFPSLFSGNKITALSPEISGVDISELNSKDLFRLDSWINTATNQMATMGFAPAKDVFKIVIPGKTLHINTTLADEYNQYIKDVVNPQVQEDMLDAMDLMNEVDYEDAPFSVPEDWQDMQEAYENFMTEPAMTAEGQELFDEPANYREWRQSMETLLDTLKTTRKRLLLSDGNKSEKKAINELIKEYEKEIEDFEIDNSDYAEQVVNNELDRLEKVIHSQDSDPEFLAKIIESNKIRERLAALKDAFERDSQKIPNKINQAFAAGIKDDSKIIARIASLETSFNSQLNNIVANIMTNNSYIQQLGKDFANTGRNQEWKDFLDKIKYLTSPDTPIHEREGDGTLGLQFLGANAYDSILPDIIGITRDMNAAKENGITQSWKKILEVSHEALRKLTFMDKPFLDSLFKKDAFGQITDRLIDHQDTESYDKVTNVIRGLKNVFYSTGYSRALEKAQAHKDWMEYQKENTDYIQLQKISKFANKHKNTDRFSEFLTYSEAEMAEYENELRNKLGNTAFEVELSKQMDKVESFLFDEFTTSRELNRNNPLRFIQHFYSDYATEADPITGFYLLPNTPYLEHMLKIDNPAYYNKDFKRLEAVGGQSFTDFYNSSTQLLNYVRTAAAIAGVDIKHNEILNLQENLGRAAMADLGFFRKVGKVVSEGLRSLTAANYEGTQENPTADISYNIDKDRKTRSGYSSYGNKDNRTVRSIMESKSHKELVKEAEALGLVVPALYQQDNFASIKAIAEAIATNITNKSSSLDLLKRINTATAIAESINTRLTTKSLIGLLKEFAEKNKLANTTKYIKVWEASNIDKVGYQYTGGLGSRIERYKLPTSWLKRLSPAEKEVKKILEKEQSNFKGNNLKFTYEGISYFKNKKGNYMAKSEDGTSVAIPKQDVEDQYELYLRKVIEDLGKSPTLGTVMAGLSYNMYKTYLNWSPVALINNRLQGVHQNNQIAASGLYGFRQDELRKTRIFFTGMGLQKLLNWAPGFGNYAMRGLGPQYAKKMEQRDIMLTLAGNMGFLDNVMADVSGGEGETNMLTNSKFVNRVKEAAGDLSMNIPESYNQLELFVSIAQNIEIEKKDVNTGEILEERGRFFDAKTMSFPFDPKTMLLKPEFDTPNNRANFIHNKENSRGESPQDLLIRKSLAVKNKTQGNYNTDDKPGIQKTMTGKAATSFMKWYFENVNEQYGLKKVDLTTGRINIKGRKIVLMERFPVLGTYLFVNNIGLYTTAGGVYALVSGAASFGTAGAIASSAAAAVLLSPATLIGAGIGGVILGNAILKGKVNVKSSWENWKLAVNFAKEISLYTARTAIKTTTWNRVNIYSDAKIDKWLGLDKNSWKYTGTTLEERRVLSSNAQEVADRFNIYIQFALVQASMIAMYALVNALNDSGDDDDDAEETLAKLSRLEQNMKGVMNLRNRHLAENSQYSSPTSMYETTTGLALPSFLDQYVYKKILRSPWAVVQGKISPEERNKEQAIGVISATTGLPKSLVTITTEGPGKLLSSKKVYEPSLEGPADNYMLNFFKNPEDKYKGLAQRKRDRARPHITNIIESRVAEIAKEGNYSGKAIKKAVSKYVKKAYSDIGAYKTEDGSYEDAFNNINYDELLESARSVEIEIEEKDNDD